MNHNPDSNQPIRHVLRDLNVDELNEPPNTSLLILSSSNETKRDEIVRIYDHMNAIADRLRHEPVAPTTSLLKRVHFDKSETATMENSTPNLGSTYTVERFQNELSNTNSLSTTNKAKTSKLPVKKQSNKTPETISKTVQIVGSKVGHKSGAVVKQQSTTTKVFVSYQQRKKLAQEAKEKLEKELAVVRLKVIRRKFGFIWIRKYLYAKKLRTKSLLLPSQLDRYYKHNVLSKCFHNWHSNVRFIRNEWRLNVKADCHFKYVFCNKLWSTWRKYMAERSVEKKAETKALNHYNSKLKQRCIYIWKSFRREQIRNKFSLVEVQKERNIEILRDYFNMWSLKLLLVSRTKKMNEIADKHNQLVQLSKCFSIWNYKFSTEKEERRKMRLAVLHYKQRLRQTCFNSFRMFLILRRRKNLQCQKLAEYADSQLVFRTFHTWLRKYHWHKRLLDMHSELLKIEANFLLRRVFVYWQTEYTFRRNLRLKEVRMKKWYEKTLKRKFFAALKQNREEHREENAKLESAFKFDSLWTKRICFEKWTLRLEEKQEVYQMHLTYKAKKHYHGKQLEICFGVWKIFVLEQRDLKGKLKKADDFYAKNTLRTYLNVINYYVKLTKYKRQNHFIAHEIYKRNTWEKYFYLWSRNYQISVESQMNSRIAILHEESKIIEKVFYIWYLKYEEKLSEEKKEEKAQNWYKKTLLRKSISIWIDVVRKSKTENDKEMLALKHDLKRLCLERFIRWKHRLNELESSKQRFLKAEQHYYRRFLIAWRREALPQLSRLNECVEARFKAKLSLKLSTLWSQWRLLCIESRRERQNMSLAVALHSKLLLRRVLTSWKFYIMRRREKHTNDLAKLNSSKMFLTNLCHKWFFQKWLSKTKELAASNAKCQLATIYYERRLKVCAYSEWKAFISERLRVKKTERQADLFLEMRVKSEVFYTWTLKYENECAMREKNMSALLMWSICVRRRFFVAWFDWYRQQKAKSNRYKQALVDRQLDILRECGRKFLVYTWDAKERRAFSHRLLRDKYRADEAVLEAKYFHMWRTKCSSKTTKLQPTKTTIGVDLSLEKRERLTKVVNEQPIRAMPRKPNHLLESIDGGTLDPNRRDPTTVKTTAHLLLPPTVFEVPSSRPLSDEIELIHIKKRLENLSIKSEKLKRLKEQQKLLLNCINSNEINNTSIFGTVFKEKNQVQLEIDELNNFVKIEKQQINELLKKHNIKS